jgi:hypothetical protein
VLLIVMISFLLLILVQQFLNHLQAGSEMEWQQLPFVKKLIRMCKAGVIDPNTLISCFSSWNYHAELEVTS